LMHLWSFGVVPGSFESLCYGGSTAVSLAFSGGGLQKQFYYLIHVFTNLLSSAISLRIFGFVKLSVARKSRLGDTDQWLYWYLSLVSYSRNDSAISLHFGGSTVVMNEILP